LGQCLEHSMAPQLVHQKVPDWELHWGFQLVPGWESNWALHLGMKLALW